MPAPGPWPPGMKRPAPPSVARAGPARKPTEAPIARTAAKWRRRIENLRKLVRMPQHEFADALGKSQIRCSRLLHPMTTTGQRAILDTPIEGPLVAPLQKFSGLP